jgi:hypothetical protein
MNFSVKYTSNVVANYAERGSSAAKIGRQILWKMAKDLGKQFNVEEVIIQGGTRTTGKYKGTVPSPVTIKVN